MSQNNDYIHPTYSTQEALRMMGKLDLEGLYMLGKLITEEKRRYALSDLRLLKKIWGHCVEIEKMQ